ncbi:protein LBH-like [Scyliorhinus torazame]
MEKVSLKEDVEHLPVQIFPDPLESVDECCRRIKGRLPSIVVELTDTGEVESGELRWPPEDFSPCEDVDNSFEVGAEPDDPSESNPEPGGSTPQGDEETQEGTAEAESDDGSRPATLPRDCQGASRQN